MREVNVEDLHYQAGLFEGEGTIRINKQTRRNLAHLAVSVANTDRTIVDEFHSIWGGSIIFSPSVDRRKEYWRWVYAARMAADFLLAIWPCLRTDKYRRRAVLGLDFQAQKQHANILRWGTEECRIAYRDRQMDFFLRMKKLNIRGVPV